CDDEWDPNDVELPVRRLLVRLLVEPQRLLPAVLEVALEVGVPRAPLALEPDEAVAEERHRRELAAGEERHHAAAGGDDGPLLPEGHHPTACSLRLGAPVRSAAPRSRVAWFLASARRLTRPSSARSARSDSASGRCRSAAGGRSSSTRPPS